MILGIIGFAAIPASTVDSSINISTNQARSDKVVMVCLISSYRLNNDAILKLTPNQVKKQIPVAFVIDVDSGTIRDAAGARGKYEISILNGKWDVYTLNMNKGGYVVHQKVTIPADVTMKAKGKTKPYLHQMVVTTDDPKLKNIKVFFLQCGSADYNEVKKLNPSFKIND